MAAAVHPAAGSLPVNIALNSHYVPPKPPTAESFYIVRIDASPDVEVPGGCFVTVESGPHTGLGKALHNLVNPKARAHTTPDIVFLLSSCLVWAKNEVVPAKPRLVVSSTYIEKTTGRGGGERDAKRRRIKDEGGGVVVGNVAAAVASLSDAQQQQQQQQQQHHATLQPQIQLRPQLVQPPPGQNGPARIILQPSLQWGVGSSTAAAAVSAAAAQNTAIHPGTIPPNSQSFQSFQRILMPNGQIISVPLTRSTLVAANTINTNLQQQQQHGELNSAVFAALARQNKIGAAAAATTTTTTTRMMASGGVGGEGATTITTTPATADAPVPPAKIFKNRDDASLPASPQK